MRIIPAILTTSTEVLAEQLKLIARVSERVHIDICDGKFVPSATFAPLALKQVVSSAMYDLHLMVQNPSEVIEQLYDLLNIKRVIIHIESVQFPTQEIEHIHGYGLEAWIAVNPETPLDVVRGHMYHADGVLFLAVHPGKQGQALLAEVLEKVRICKIEHPIVKVGVDGGIKKEHIAQLKLLGVDEICVGSAVFGAQDPAKEFQKLLLLVEGE